MTRVLAIRPVPDQPDVFELDFEVAIASASVHGTLSVKMAPGFVLTPEAAERLVRTNAAGLLVSALGSSRARVN